MADEKITIDIEANTKEAEQNFTRLQTQIREARINFQQAEEAGNKINMAKFKKELDDLEDKLEVNTLKSKQFDDALAGLPGAAGQAGQAIKGLDGAFKLLIANPIVAIIAGTVAVFTALYAAMKQTKDGTAAITGAMDAFGNVVKPIINFISNVGVKAFTLLADGVNYLATKLGLVDEKQVEAQAAFRATEKVIKQNQTAIEGEIAVMEAQGLAIDKTAAKRKEAINQELNLLNTKKQAFGELTADEEAKIIELENKKKIIDAQLVQYNKDQAAKEKEERKKELLDQVSDYKGSFAARLENAKRFYEDENYELQQKLLADEITQYEYDQAVRENQKSLNQFRSEELTLQRNAELKKLKEGLDAGLITRKEYEDATTAIVNEYAVKQNEIVANAQAQEIKYLTDATEVKKNLIKAEQEAREALTDSIIGGVNSIGNVFSMLAGKNKSLAKAGLLIEKGAALAKVVVDTARGITAAVASAAPLLANPVTAPVAAKTLGLTKAALTIAGTASAASIIASAAKGISQINAVEIPGAKGSGGGVGGGTSSGGGGSVSLPSFSTPSIGAPSIGGGAAQQGTIAGIVAGTMAANESQSQPLRAYVVQNDLRTQGQLDRRIRTAARLGG